MTQCSSRNRSEVRSFPDSQHSLIDRTRLEVSRATVISLAFYAGREKRNIARDQLYRDVFRSTSVTSRTGVLRSVREDFTRAERHRGAPSRATRSRGRR